MRARNVLREFNSYDEAQAFYHGPDYSAAHPLREPHSDCDFVIVEGYDGPQPAPIGTPPAPAALKGYWIVHVDVTDPEGYKPYQAANVGGVRQVRRALSWCAADATRSPKGTPALPHRGGRISELRGGARVLSFARIPGGHRRCAPARPSSTWSSIEGLRRQVIAGSVSMAKGYWIGRVEVNNEEGYKPYAAANPAIFKKFGAQVRGSRRQVRVPGRAEPLAQRGDRISRLCDGGRLLSFAGVSGQPENPPGQRDHRSRSSSRATTARSRRFSRITGGRPCVRFLACLVVLLFGSAALAQSATPEQKAQLAPTGALRAAIVTIPFLAKKDASGAVTGVAPDLGAEMARVLGVPYQPTVYRHAARRHEGDARRRGRCHFPGADARAHRPGRFRAGLHGNGIVAAGDGRLADPDTGRRRSARPPDRGLRAQRQRGDGAAEAAARRRACWCRSPTTKKRSR